MDKRYARAYPTRQQVDEALFKESKEWAEHGDCKFCYEAHLLAMEVRRLRAMMVPKKKGPSQGGKERGV